MLIFDDKQPNQNQFQEILISSRPAVLFCALECIGICRGLTIAKYTPVYCVVGKPKLLRRLHNTFPIMISYAQFQWANSDWRNFKYEYKLKEWDCIAVGQCVIVMSSLWMSELLSYQTRKCVHVQWN